VSSIMLSSIVESGMKLPRLLRLSVRDPCSGNNIIRLSLKPISRYFISGSGAVRNECGKHTNWPPTQNRLPVSHPWRLCAGAAAVGGWDWSLLVTRLRNLDKDAGGTAANVFCRITGSHATSSRPGRRPRRGFGSSPRRHARRCRGLDAQGCAATRCSISSCRR
jgi:hypothetical protein